MDSRFGVTLLTSILSCYIFYKKRLCELLRVLDLGSRDPTKHLFKELKILCSYKLYKFSVAVFMFRFIKGELPDIFTNMYIFYSDVHNYVTRNVNELKLPFCKLEICQRHIRYTGVKIWNLVSSCIIHNCSLYTF